MRETSKCIACGSLFPFSAMTIQSALCDHGTAPAEQNRCRMGRGSHPFRSLWTIVGPCLRPGNCFGDRKRIGRYRQALQRPTLERWVSEEWLAWSITKWHADTLVIVCGNVPAECLPLRPFCTLLDLAFVSHIVILSAHIELVNGRDRGRLPKQTRNDRARKQH